MTEVTAAERRRRLLAARDRIRAAAPRALALRTAADPDTGETWDRGQVLAHTAEILPYWSEQADLVAGRGEGVPFGRVKSNAARVAAIERDRHEDPGRLLDRLDEGVTVVLALLDRLDGEALTRTGTHQTLGEMTVARIVDRFIVEHLEEHADQLDE